jgi:mannose-6-phosphate isomerase-like protein (cupin superfamily)
MKDNNIFNQTEIPKKIFDDRWVRFAFGPQGTVKSKNLNLGIVNFDENKVSLTHKHSVEEALFVLSGKGKIKIGKNIFNIKENDFVHIPENTNHCISTEPNSKVRILFIFSGEIIIDH